MSDSSPHERTRVLVFMTGRNCADFVVRAAESIAEQDYSEVHLLFVDDASDDETFERARRVLGARLPDRHTLVRNESSLGKAGNAAVHLRGPAGQHDVVAVVDADDALLDTSVLSLVVQEYERGSDVVWTNYRLSSGGRGHCGPLDPDLSARRQRWSTSHLFTFRSLFLANVPDAYFQDDQGQWFRAACDFALAHPILDQTRRWRYLDVDGYSYTSDNPTSHHNGADGRTGLSSPTQIASARAVLAKTPLPCLRPRSRFRTGEPPRPRPTALHAARAVLQGVQPRHVLCLGASEVQFALALELRSAGASVEWLLADATEAAPAWWPADTVPCDIVEFMGYEGAFLDTSSVGVDAPLDLVLLGGIADLGAVVDRVLALPALASRLRPEGFSFLVFDGVSTEAMSAMTTWSQLAPELAVRSADTDQGLTLLSTIDR